MRRDAAASRFGRVNPGVPPISLTANNLVSKKTIIQLGISTVVIGVIISLFLSSGSISWHELKHSIAGFGVTGCAIAFLCLAGQIFFMIFRYWALIPTEHSINIFRMAYAISVGQAVNTYFPARAGDFLKAALMTRDPKTAFSGNVPSKDFEGDDRRFTFLKAMGLIVADRVVDVGTLILLVLFSGALFIPADLVAKREMPPTWVIAAIVVGILAAIVIGKYALGTRVSDKLKKIAHWMKDFRAGFRGMVKPRKLALGILFAALSWECEILSLQTLSSMQGFPMTFTQAVFVLLALNFFISVPLSIANFGPFEAGVVMALQAVEKIPTEQALAVATVHHLAQMSSVVVMAAISFLLLRFVAPKSAR